MTHLAFQVTHVTKTYHCNSQIDVTKKFTALYLIFSPPTDKENSFAYNFFFYASTHCTKYISY